MSRIVFCKTEKEEELKCRLALQQVNGIGPVRFKRLLETLGSATQVFQASAKDIAHISGLGIQVGKEVNSFVNYGPIDEELDFIERNNIEILHYDKANFPAKLKECYDAPPLLFYKGTPIGKKEKVIAIVGTRKNTDYGRQVCEKLISELVPYKPLIVSGLAYGIDIIAHKKALSSSLDTVAVLPNGLDSVYPSLHKKSAQDMIEQGGLITEYWSGSKPDREHFPTRNRIVAGMADAIIVIESGKRGGSMITAELGFSYNREVFAVPGRLGDKYSLGCNNLISSLKAQILTGAQGLVKAMNWSEQKVDKTKQGNLFNSLNSEEQKVYDVLLAKNQAHVDEIILKTTMPSSSVSSILFSLEMKGIIRSLPGKLFRLS